MSNEKSLFNEFLIKLGERPLQSVVLVDSTALLEIELSEMEDKMGLPHVIEAQGEEPL